MCDGVVYGRAGGVVFLVHAGDNEGSIQDDSGWARDATINCWVGMCWNGGEGGVF